ncbi:MAG TPA: undecaprenyldiphospho-muramoylpentapeptide beta-N-acetylglucosaminyltransferase [Candidatus Eisenbacteria bacterium]|uniref:UDP-N-acetylglucosamine--N-acetylmuramyl-(pentapeptide) pyrophosphoryl-undecaprenol N-acetylglucosamine transferase n=1 Tax=Eiseniibacteriota bacterium TaxID=2212470 RepID=A0A7V2F3G3_UNCEI|nr:undecaprenyldiphospho-muramoylpentapeptide beta-N-acetylglucosaminyltransferase [Candidatus Eisenbacteria bacterium]
MTGPRILFAGGGTGGHVYPALAVAEELKRRFAGFEPLFVGTRGGLESSVIEKAGFAIRYISSRGVRGRGFFGKALTLAALSAGFVQSMKIVRAFRPDLVFGAGGYASAAVVLAASAMRRPIVLQEQNSVPGLANRLLASRASRIYLGFERAAEHFKDRRCLVYTGNPLRDSIVNPRNAEPLAAFGLEEGSPVLLVFGGSQGASRLNRAAVEYLEGDAGMQAIIQTGKRDFEWVKARLDRCGARAFVSPYIADIDLAYRAATVALARAGALSVSELAAAGLPAILAPYPHAADDHQRSNAALLVEAGGALLVEDHDLDGATLSARLGELLEGGGERLATMRSSLERMARPEATSIVCDDMAALIGREGAPGAGADRGEGA